MSTDELEILAAVMTLTAAASAVVVTVTWIFLIAAEWVISSMESFPRWHSEAKSGTSERSACPRALTARDGHLRTDRGTVESVSRPLLARFSAQVR
jgi:hypothetical protein